jgi:hypothetical protein
MNERFKKFNENFFSKSKQKIVWYDRQGVFNLDDTRVVTITIDDIGTRDQYNGYVVEIFNKFNGTIIKKFFKFENFLTFRHRTESEKHYHVWLYRNEFEWYISVPTNTKEMSDKIFDWINQFK